MTPLKEVSDSVLCDRYVSFCDVLMSELQRMKGAVGRRDFSMEGTCYGRVMSKWLAVRYAHDELERRFSGNVVDEQNGLIEAEGDH